MLNYWTLILIALAYMALLFAIAWIGDRKRLAAKHRHLRAIIYSLSLAVYCTSWTFYGAVGSAATTGWGYLPIYLGPILVMLLGADLIRRIARNSREQRITSIADYIAHRYGRSHLLAVLVTLAAIAGSVPYIALQLKGITTSMEVIASSTGATAPLSTELSLYVALSLGLFSIVFGTRNLDASEHYRGLMWAIAFESLVKLLAFIAIGTFVIFIVFDGLGDVAATLRDNQAYSDLFSPWTIPQGFGIQLVLAMAAILCLPRQFHVAIVEFRDEHDLKVARWLFPAYLLLFAALVVPIAVAGLDRFSGQAVNPDTFVLALPIAFDQTALTVLAFVGGFSAATGMVIVATVALAIMVSNDIVMPLILRSGVLQARAGKDLSRTLLFVRRVSIIGITLLAYLYFRAIESGVPLASIGLLSFTAAAQFAPPILLGLYWRGASRQGALWGLGTGVTFWLFFMLIPSFYGEQLSRYGAFPDLSFNDAAGLSLLLNAATLVLVSLLLPDREPAGMPSGSDRHHGGLITLGELEATIGRFLGLDASRDALNLHLGSNAIEPRALASPATIQFGERLLAGSIGSASARTVLSTALHHRGLGPDAVMELLDRTSQAVQFNRELLEATLDNMSQGVSVVDRDLRLVGWNRRYLELMEYPEGTVYLGQPIEDLIRINAGRGLVGEDGREAEIQKRLKHLRGGTPYRFERQWLDDKVIEIQGNPMPGGGYVTTFSDISHFKQIERQLQTVNETLEQRVQQRTRELSEAINQVESARQSAEQANQSKTRFLAAASHDLLQPMNAARLFISILRQQQADPDSEQARLVMRADRSLAAAEELLSALLDISKLDSGLYQAETGVVDTAALFEQLRGRFKALAGNKDLQLRVRPTPHAVITDRNLLHRILQNFLANALRYTEEGGVLLGAQVRGKELKISVWDTGVGIDQADTVRIFREFQRLDYAERLDEKGLGLGLAICERISHMLGHRMEVTSTPGRGSRFSVTVPIATDAERRNAEAPEQAGGEASRLEGLQVLCIDNEHDILDGMKLLLERWGCEVFLAANAEEATTVLSEHGVPGLVLVDYHLSESSNGLDLMQHLAELADAPLSAIVITADRSAELEDAVRHRGYRLLRKPIKPAALRALMTNTLKAR